MTGEEKGKLRNRRWWDWYDGLPHAALRGALRIPILTSRATTG